MLIFDSEKMISVVDRRVMSKLILLMIGCSLMYFYIVGQNSDPIYSSKKQTKLPVKSILQHLEKSTKQPVPSEASEIKNRSVADFLAKKVRVLCWVMTQPDNHDSKAQHVKRTWGKRCNKLLFMSTVEDPSLPSIKLPIKEGWDHLWGKTKAAFRYVYEHHRREADWFMKADDDTYVIVENLRYMLSAHEPSSPIYFGERFKPFTKQGYMDGGAGYVLSRAALDLFVNKGLPSPHFCKADDTGPEDVVMGKCLDKIGVKAMDSRDERGRGRFFAGTPEAHLFPNPDREYWYWQYIYYPSKEGLTCCSDHVISFHNIKPKEMYVMDYLIYQLRPYGIYYSPNKESLMDGQANDKPTEAVSFVNNKDRQSLLLTNETTFEGM